MSAKRNKMTKEEETALFQCTKSLRDNPLRGGPAAGAVIN
jgi:hypothetical protein